MKSIFTLLALYLSTLTLLTACSKENAYQTDANQQNALESQQKTQELDQVQGTYEGPMQLAQGPLNVKINLIVTQTSTTEADQINKLQTPSLSGSMSFTDVTVTNAMTTFPDLVQYMGVGLSVNFLNGDFNSDNSSITLPYNSSGTAAIGGDQVIGTFQNNTFTGEWDSHTGGKLGTFSLERSGS
jgi:hypothetical protein